MNSLDLRTLDSDHIPIIYEIPDIDDIFKTDIKTIFTSSIAYPKFSLGFHHYIHQSNDKLPLLEKQFENKKKVYCVINKFEPTIDEYEDTLFNSSNKHFKKKKLDIVSAAFFKLWELLHMFDLIKATGPEIVSTHLSEGPGGFVQALLYYRDTYAKSTTKDKYYTITPNDKESFDTIILDKGLEKESRIVSFNNKQSGNLGDIKVVEDFLKFQKKKSNLVTADGSYIYKNDNLREQMSFSLFIGEIIVATSIQEEGGNFVLKILEAFTEPTLKLVCILKSFYKDVYIVKPLTSKLSSSERYLVCKRFKSAGAAKKIEILKKLLKEINSKPQQFVNNIFADYKLSEDMQVTYIHSNISIANKFFKTINEMSTFVMKENYRGDGYQKRRNMQIESTKFWLDNFYSKTAKLDQFTKDIIVQTNKLVEQFKETYDFDE